MRSVVHRTAPWIAQHVIGITDCLEALRRSGGAAVWMARARRTPVSADNLLARRLPGHTQDDVRIPTLTTRHQTSTSS
jgi:hypothetical protein